MNNIINDNLKDLISLWEDNKLSSLGTEEFDIDLIHAEVDRRISELSFLLEENVGNEEYQFIKNRIINNAEMIIEDEEVMCQMEIKLEKINKELKN